IEVDPQSKQKASTGIDFSVPNSSNIILSINVLDEEKKVEKIEAVWKYLGSKVQEHQATFPITGAQLHEIFSSTPQERCDEVASIINKYSDKFEINTPLRMAHFLGQIGTETTGILGANRGKPLTALKEVPCYRESSIRNQFARYSKYCDLFEGYNCVDYSACATSTSTVPCNPGVPDISLPIKQKYICSAELFDYVYSCSARKPGSSGDLGNGSPASKDGSTFLGRGFIHLTGKSNYTQLSNAWNTAPENSSNKKYFHKHASEGGHIDELENNTEIAMLAAMYYWKMKECNSSADLDDTDSVTYKVNGGYSLRETRKEHKDNAILILKK
ncbi:hypothetical protein, partial [Cellulophaga sp. BC115SP]|uniref:glycoside hydrolase family 19 protein n=1 Tax=Cellulophaga sp. BC115SP TaxID=2683263 RepID=UPI001412A00C|nr:hypothetical protein [Cellulophaga sp. BC115SP]